MPKPTQSMSPTKRARESDGVVNVGEEPRKKRKQDLEQETGSSTPTFSTAAAHPNPPINSQAVEEHNEHRARKSYDRRRRKREGHKANRSIDDRTGNVPISRQKVNHSALIEGVKSHKSGSSSTDSKAVVLTTREDAEEGHGWSLSSCAGGRFLDKDPVFAGNEKYLIVAVESCLQVVSCETSLLVRCLWVEAHESVTDFALSPSKPDHVYASSLAGRVYEWNWRTAELCHSWNSGNAVVGLSATREETYDTLFITQTRKSGKKVITAQRVTDSPFKASEPLPLLRRRDLSHNVQCLEGGKVVVTFAANNLLMGICEGWTGSLLPDSVYVWREIALPEPITSIDVRLKPALQDIPKKAITRPAAVPAIDVVVGCVNGAILVYEDLLNRILAKEKPGSGNKGTDITSRRLHWHRAAPNVVRWSRDGNYVISGGSETVLVLWQLETNEKSFLPHLSASIRNLAISPVGASYAIHLEDNSVMVLSTSDLKPTTSISGPAVPGSRHQNRFAQICDANVEPRSWSGLSNPGPLIPAALNPKNPDQILLAVSNPDVVNPGNRSNPTILQTFDTRLNSQISRQALTRNNTTTFNIGPGGQKLHEPSVQFLKVSHDGQWLATIDEWVQAERDLQALFSDEKEKEGRLQHRSEIYLKFWSWNAQNKTWELVTRIDKPHMHANGAGRILDLTSNDTKSEFATVGDDGFVRLWVPQIRRNMDGLVVKNKLGQALQTWSCRNAVQLENQSIQDSARLPSASLAFSNDGSLLATAWKSQSANGAELLHFIDASVGEIRETRTLDNTSSSPKLGFLGRYFISVSNELQVWDVVEQTRTLSVLLNIARTSRYDGVSLTVLAVNVLDQTFAIAFPTSGDAQVKPDEQLHSEIMVFDAGQSEPIYHTKSSPLVTALLPAASAGGYVVLDESASIRRLSPRATTLHVQQIEEQMNLPSSGLENMFGRNPRSITNSAQADHEGGPVIAGEDQNLPVRQKQLASIFDGPSFFAPPVSEMFEQVAGLFSRKPQLSI